MFIVQATLWAFTVGISPEKFKKVIFLHSVRHGLIKKFVIMIQSVPKKNIAIGYWVLREQFWFNFTINFTNQTDWFFKKRCF